MHAATGHKGDTFMNTNASAWAQHYGILITLLLTCMLVSLTTASSRAAPPANLLAENPAFTSPAPDASKPPGWAGFWSRSKDGGRGYVDTSVMHSGSPSYHISSTARADWSLTYGSTVAVNPGEVLTLSAWVKCDQADTAQISVVTRTRSGDVISWNYAPAPVSGTTDWQQLQTQFIVPDDCATVQFRLSGSGIGTYWITDCAVLRLHIAHLIGTRSKTIRLYNDSLDVLVNGATGSLTIRDRRSRRQWTQTGQPGSAVVISAVQSTHREVALKLVDKLNGGVLTVKYLLHSAAPEIDVTLSKDGSLNEPVFFPPALDTGAHTDLILPLNEGIMYAAGDQTVSPSYLTLYAGHGGLSMPWYGIVDRETGSGIETIVHTPDDAAVKMDRLGSGRLTLQPTWEASKGTMHYPRALTYVVIGRGGYVAQAKYYRRQILNTSAFVTLAAKRRANPDVDKLVGAADVWNWTGNKVELCREMKKLGMNRVLWSNGGSRDEVQAINRLGYLTSVYDNFQDVYPPGSPSYLNTRGWPADLVWTRDGQYMHGWDIYTKKPDGTNEVLHGGVIASSRAVTWAINKVPGDVAAHGYTCRFIDTTTATPWREDYNPAHPLTRSDDRRYKMRLLDYVSNTLHQVLGTETGIEPAVPYVHYFEGMMSLAPYRLPDSGRDLIDYKVPTPEFVRYQVGYSNRIPLWELVYHECVVSYWYWGDSSNKEPEFWDQRDLYNILYGTPPLYLFDDPVWAKYKSRFVSSYNSVAPVIRRHGYSEMISHWFVTPDGSVQATHWSDGETVIVNFGESVYHTSDGRRIDPHGFLAGRDP